MDGTSLSAFLDDELGDDAAVAVARHVADCGRCRSELESLRATRDALRELPSLQAPVLRGEVRRHPSLRSWTRRVVALTTLLTAALALGAAAYVVGGDDGEVVPPVERFVLDHLARTGQGPVPAPLDGPTR